MSQELKVVVGSDLQKKPQNVDAFISEALTYNPHAIVLNGDFGIDIYSHAYGIQQVAKRTASQNIPVFYFGASHEPFEIELMADVVQQKYPHMHYIKNPQTHRVRGFDLVFVPGGVALAGGKFYLELNHPSPYRHDKELVLESSEPITANNTRINYLSDLRNVVQGIDPARAILFAHEPLKTTAREKGTDFAEYGWRQIDGAIIPGELIYDWFEQNYGLKRNSIGEEEWNALKEKYDIVMRRNNAGNIYPEDLESLLTVSVHGHFEESGGNICDRASNPIEEGKYVPNGRFNASALDAGTAGYVERIPGFVRFRRLRFVSVDKAEPLEYEDIEWPEEFNRQLTCGDFEIAPGKIHKTYDRFVKMPLTMRMKKKIDLANLKKPALGREDLPEQYRGFDKDAKSGLHIRKTVVLMPEPRPVPTKLTT
ncbi:MAG: hypothetical protein QW331_02715 [Candidatus Woesearchaeota archaeon]